jgi:hypothetical protein
MVKFSPYHSRILQEPEIGSPLYSLPSVFADLTRTIVFKRCDRESCIEMILQSAHDLLKDCSCGARSWIAHCRIIQGLSVPIVQDCGTCRSIQAILDPLVPVLNEFKQLFSIRNTEQHLVFWRRRNSCMRQDL